MGGVVAADGGDVAELKAFPHGWLVGAVLGSEGWADLCQGADFGHFLVGQEEILWAGLGPDSLALALGLFDSLHANIGAEVYDVDGAVGYVAHFDGAVDGFLLCPIGAGGGKVGGVDTALADELVLEIVDDVSAFAVELDDAAALGDSLHNLADEVVGAHADLVLFV